MTLGEAEAAQSNPSMRILRVAQKLYPEHRGGGAYHVHAVSRDQAAMGHEVTVLTVGDDPRREQRNGYTVVRCPARVSALGNDVAPGVWRRLGDAEEYDVVHAHSHLYASTNMAAARRRIEETPLAITNHGLYSQNAPEWLFDIYLRTLGRMTFDAADLVFCYTDTDRDRLREIGVSSRVEVIANGIDTERFTPDGPRDDRIRGDPAVLFVGRLVEGKRPGDALDAFVRISNRFPDAVLSVCGTGPLRDELGDAARAAGVADRVRFLGHVDYELMPAVYRAADAMVLPSRSEGLPRTVLEALASGVPVVVSDLDQIGPLVAGGGETAPVGDVEQLAEALADVLESPDAYTPTETVASSFSWAETVERTTDALRRL